LINQQHGEQQSHPAVEHPDALVNRMAHTIGFYAARTYLRLQNLTHTAREATDRLDQPKTEQTESPSQSAKASEQESGQTSGQTEEPNQPATRQAEEMVDYLTQRLNSFTAFAKLTFQRTVARVREDTEDVWAEAQNIRHHQREPLPQ